MATFNENTVYYNNDEIDENIHQNRVIIIFVLLL